MSAPNRPKAAIQHLVSQALATENAKCAYLTRSYRDARSFWRYLKEAGEGIAVKVREHDLSIELLNGSLVKIYSCENPDALRGISFKFVGIDELADASWCKLPETRDLKCEDCGVVNEDVEKVCCPYLLEIEEKIEICQLCSNCYQERAKDI